MDEADALVSLSCEHHENGKPVLDAVEPGKPGDGFSGRLDRVFITGHFSSVGPGEMFPFKVIACGRVKDAEEEIALIREYQDFGCTLCEQTDRGELPVRVTHNDTKTNNVLFDRDTLDPLVIIDLDTCMPGYACYDFGDTIRFAACTAEEDQPEGMKLDLDLFRAYTEGYLSEMKDVLTLTELESLATGAAVITLELASRFLADYLSGDRYFRIDFPEQNLRRAQAQLVLFEDMMVHMEDMKRIICEATQKEEELKIYTIQKT